jgi:CRP/FNR family transcriptional regulator
MSRQIGEIPTRTFNAGEAIFKEGDDAKGEAFLVHLGRVEIRKLVAGEDRLLTVLKKGDFLGELALFRNAPRSATAIAAEPVTLMVIPANRVDHMVRSNPTLAVAMIRDLANRMLAAEDRARDAEGRSLAAEARALVAEKRAAEAEERAREAEKRAAEAERRAVGQG